MTAQPRPPAGPVLTVLFLGPLRERMGCGEMTVAAAGTVRDVWERVTSSTPGHPGAGPPTVRAAVNLEYREWDCPVAPGDVVAFIPPVSGGTEGPDVDVAIGEEPIDVARLLGAAASPSAGATCSFTGSVRDSTDGVEVHRLDYEAYMPMAERVTRRIAVEAARCAAVSAVAVRHRIGSLAAGEVSLAVVVSAPHRAAAFEACRRIVEAMKAEVPIWKREHLATGARWVGEPAPDEASPSR